MTDMESLVPKAHLPRPAVLIEGPGRALSVISTYRAHSNHQLLLVVLTLQIIPPLLPLAPKPSANICHTQHRYHQEHAGDQYDPPRAAEQRIL